RPELLFNIGQAYRLAGKPQEALAAYRGFLRRVPDAPQRAEVRERISSLEGALHTPPRPAVPPRPETEVQPAPVTSPETVTGAPERPRPLYKKWWLWTAVGAGVVVVVGVGVGVGVGVSSSGTTPTAPTSFGTFRF